ncbi:hypothetical protein [Gimesia algae]|uniref:Uncharacterized protein n=1 Tax=Gimesia algae TaxID=2527971 RepID=A0A517V6H1_9PLAN|nr:hypothetical protein [Gimesia algae]QDT88583.1 hypothetical protein Pan161_02010 [Gimesia algae]
MRFIKTFFLLFSGIVGLTLAQQNDLIGYNAADKPENKSKKENSERLQAIQALHNNYEQAERDSARYAAELKRSGMQERSAKKNGSDFSSSPQNTSPLDQKKAESKLSDAVQRAFNLRHQLQMAQIELVEQNLRDTRAQLTQRKQEANIIIRRRIEELTSSEDLSWLGSTTKKTTSPLIPPSVSKLQPSSDVFVYPRDAVKNYIEAAIVLDTGKAANGATNKLAEKETLKQWGEVFKKHAPQIQNVLLDTDALHSHVVTTAGGERLIFELKRTTGKWRLTTISRVDQ